MNKNAHRLIRLGVFLVIVMLGQTHAHDFWIEAQPFYTAPGATVELSIHVGNDFVGDSLPNVVNLYTDFSVYHNGERKDVPGEMGRDPAGYFSAAESGTYLIGYQSEFFSTDMDSETFIKYLSEEGLRRTLQQFNKQSVDVEKIGERYIRHAKALFQIGKNTSGSDWSKVIGYPLELLPLANPYRLATGAQLPLRLLYQGKPLADAQVSAFNKGAPEQIQKAISDHNGEVTITLNKRGPWLVKAVKILPLVDAEAQWQSHWASLTFALL